MCTDIHLWNTSRESVPNPWEDWMVGISADGLGFKDSDLGEGKVNFSFGAIFGGF